MRALDELHVEGIPTTASFHRWVLDTEEFRTGTHTTRFVEQALSEGRFQPGERPEPAAALRTDAPTLPPVVAADGDRAEPVRLSVEVEGRLVPVLLWGEEVALAPTPPASATGHGAGESETILAPMQGTILQVMVEPGQAISAGDVVCILEAMKMENHIAATHDGTVREVAVSKGDVVQNGAILVTLE